MRRICIQAKMDDYPSLRLNMVSTQIERRGLTNPRLLAALRVVPRHEFVPEELRHQAYEDHPLSIGQGQTISQPYIVALMTSLLALQGDETVLEVGTGSGYQAAVLSQMVRQVHTIERHITLAESAAQTLKRLGYDNIQVHVGDGTLGWLPAAPYAGILVTAAAPSAPQPLLDQLDEGGRLVLPVGARSMQMLQVWSRVGGRFEVEEICAVAFVPLLGRHGWEEEAWQDSG